MIAAAIVCAAALSQAATMTWSVLNIQNSPDVTATEGWLVELYSSAVEYDYAKALSGDIEAKYTGASVATGTRFRAGESGLGSYSALATESLYMVIYDATTIGDAKNYIVSDVVSATVGADGGDITLAYGNMGSTGTTNKFLNSTWTATAVPEPTSGLLLLLGMAGLALRRRRA